MKEFQIDFIWDASIKINAESEDEALEKFNDMSHEEIANQFYGTPYEEITSIEWVK